MQKFWSCCTYFYSGWSPRFENRKMHIERKFHFFNLYLINSIPLVRCCQQTSTKYHFINPLSLTGTQTQKHQPKRCNISHYNQSQSFKHISIINLIPISCSTFRCLIHYNNICIIKYIFSLEWYLFVKDIKKKGIILY